MVGPDEQQLGLGPPGRELAEGIDHDVTALVPIEAAHEEDGLLVARVQRPAPLGRDGRDGIRDDDGVGEGQVVLAPHAVEHVARGRRDADGLGRRSAARRERRWDRRAAPSRARAGSAGRAAARRPAPPSSAGRSARTRTTPPSRGSRGRRRRAARWRRARSETTAGPTSGRTRGGGPMRRTSVRIGRGGRARATWTAEGSVPGATSLVRTVTFTPARSRPGRRLATYVTIPLCMASGGQPGQKRPIESGRRAPVDVTEPTVFTVSSCQIAKIGRLKLARRHSRPMIGKCVASVYLVRYPVSGFQIGLREQQRR